MSNQLVQDLQTTRVDVSPVNNWFVQWALFSKEAEANHNFVEKKPAVPVDGGRLFELAGSDPKSHGGYLYEGDNGWYHSSFSHAV